MPARASDPAPDCSAGRRAWAAAVCFTVLLPGCQPSRGEKSRPSGPPVSSPVTFTDVAATAGLRFRYGYGGRSPLDLMEVSGGGCGFLDADGDGWLDILLVGQRRCAFYRNNRDGTFTDVTRQAGLTEQGWWMGCAAADWDRDGDVDLFLSGYRTSRLYRNQGEGRFVDVSAAMGVAPPGWTAGAAFADVDRDGWLDLYVGRYARFDERSIRFCTIEGVKTSCGPEMYDPERGLFYHNEGGRRFREATREFGLADAHGKTWGVCFADMDEDGWADLYLANDEVPCDLYQNREGRFRNIGLESGTAFSRDGVRQGGMGVDWGDYDNDGRLDLVVTTFFQQPKSLYRNEGGGQFVEESDTTGVALPTLPYIAWGTRFFDMDHDGWRDLVIANGHVNDNAERIDPANHFAQPLQLFHNEGAPEEDHEEPRKDGTPSSEQRRLLRGNPTRPDGTPSSEQRRLLRGDPTRFAGRAEAPAGAAAGMPARVFRDVAAQSGPAFQRPIVGRGVAVGDTDNDGDVDLLIADAAGSPLLLRNDTDNRHHWLSVRVVGANGRSDAIGARVSLVAGGRRQVAEVNSGGSYFATHDPRVHFGLGAAARVERLQVRWPSGQVEQRRDVPADQFLTLRERGSRS